MIVIKSNPGEYYSANGDLIFVVDEATKAHDPVTYVDYKYIADIYINSVLAVRLKAVPHPDTFFGIFNIGNIVRNYLTVVFSPVAGELQAQELGTSEFFVDVQVKFGEEYNDTLYTNVVSDIERRYFNHYNGRMIGELTILPDYLDKVASSRPLIVDVDLADEFALVPYFPTNTTTIPILVNGVTALSVTPTDAEAMQIINLSPVVLGSFGATIVGDYTVEIADVVYTFKAQCSGIYKTVRLHFLNKLGGFESKNFNKVSRKNNSIQKNSFGALPYKVAADGSVNYYDGNGVYNDNNTVYYSQYSEQMTLNSDFISDDEYVWLQELLASPMVYMERDGYFIPCDITERSFEVRKAVNDKLTNITITIQFADKFNTQSR